VKDFEMESMKEATVRHENPVVRHDLPRTCCIVITQARGMPRQRKFEGRLNYKAQ
jgi:hypothetical protein